MTARNASRGRILFSTLSRRWLAVVLVPIIFGVAIYVAEADDQPRFRSTSSVLLQTTDLGAVLAGVPDLGQIDPSRAVATERIIASVPEVRARALEQLGPADAEAAATADVTFSAAESFNAGDADVLDITVTADSAPLARALATAVAEQYISFRAEVANGEIEKARNQLRARIAEVQGDPAAAGEYSALVSRTEKLETLLLIGNGRARLLTPGGEAEQVAPKPLQRGIIAAVLGLLVGAVMGLAVERLDKRVRADEEIAERLEAPVLAKLPDPRRLGKRGLVVALGRPDSAETEAFRLLRANLRFSLLSRDGHSVGVTSALEGEGKTFVASNLAVVAAAAGARVVLVDLDLHRPTVHRAFEVERSPGVSDVLTGGSRLEASLVHVPIPGEFGAVDGARGTISLLCAGTPTPNPGEVIASMALRGLIRELEEQFELVVIDTPPTSIVSDAIPIASAVSGMISVVRAPSARRPEVEGLKRALESTGGTMGVVLTAAWRGPSSYYAYKGPEADSRGSGAGPPGQPSILRSD